MLPTYHDAEGEEVAAPIGAEAKPEFKNKLLGAIEANLHKAEEEALITGDTEEAARIEATEQVVEKEKGS